MDVRRHHGEVRRVVAALGKPSRLDLAQIPGKLRRADLLVTRTAVLRRTLRDLRLRDLTGVTVAQVHRAGLDMIPTGDFALKFGDHLTVVGPQEGIRLAAAELGNEPAALQRTFLLPVFIGLALGILVGAIPLRVPGLPVPLQIGLAGGPFLVAIGLSQLGNVGSIVWYMPAAANQAVREMGLCVFLACVGFQCGGEMPHGAAQAGMGFIIAGAAITIIPALVVACFARLALRMNFITLSGWLAGTMTSTPALALATEDAQSDHPVLAYASVTPLCEILPIICAEVLAIIMR